LILDFLGKVGYKYLVELGVPIKNAWALAKSSKGWWRLSLNPIINQAMPDSWFKELGLVSMENKLIEFKILVKTAVCDKRTYGGVRGPGREAGPTRPSN
jgi:hypothetical protein